MKNIGAILLLIILPFFFYLEFVSSHNIFSQKDWVVSYPLREAAIKMLKDKTLPLWTPYMLCGNPLFADLELAIGYPLYIFDFFMSVTKAVRWNFMLHLSLGGIFMYLFLRILNLTCFGAVFGAITFMLGGYMQVFMPHKGLWVNTIYIPLIFLLFELSLKNEKKRYVVFGGIALAFQILSGIPQIVYYTLLALFLYAVYYSLVREPSAKFTPIICFTGLVSLGFLLCAFQLIPTCEFFLQSARYHFQVAKDASNMGPMLPHAILFFIGVADPYTSGFIGISGLVLALVAVSIRKNKLRLFFAGLCILVLASAFKITHLYKILFHIPGFNMFNGLHRFVSIYAFGISILAGFGASALSKTMNSNNNHLKKRISLSLVVFASILILIFSLNYFLKDYMIDAGHRFIEKKVFALPGHPHSLDYYYKKVENLHNASLEILGLAILPVMGLLLMTVLRKNRRISSPVFQAGLICILLLELYAHWDRLDWKLINPARYYRQGEAVSFIKKDTSIYRVAGLDHEGRYHFDYENSRKINDLLVPNLSHHYRMQDPQGMHNFTLTNYWQALELINRKKFPLEDVSPGDKFHLLAITNPYHNLIDLLNVKYLLSYYPVTEGKRWKLIFDPVIEKSSNGASAVKVYRNKQVIPRAFMVYNYAVAPDKDTLFKLLDAPGFNARETVVLDTDFDYAAGPPSANKVEITKYSPLEIKIDAHTEKAGILVLGDSFYPGWLAKVDGRRVKILRAYSIFRAIPLPEGSHRITFNYFPFSFIGGCVITVITLCFISLEGVRKLIRSLK
jgi:hypothetical protein